MICSALAVDVRVGLVGDETTADHDLPRELAKAVDHSTWWHVDATVRAVTGTERTLVEHARLLDQPDYRAVFEAQPDVVVLQERLDVLMAAADSQDATTSMQAARELHERIQGQGAETWLWAPSAGPDASAEDQALVDARVREMALELGGDVGIVPVGAVFSRVTRVHVDGGYDALFDRSGRLSYHGSYLARCVIATSLTGRLCQTNPGHGVRNLSYDVVVELAFEDWPMPWASTWAEDPSMEHPWRWQHRRVSESGEVDALQVGSEFVGATLHIPAPESFRIGMLRLGEQSEVLVDGTLQLGSLSASRMPAGNPARVFIRPGGRLEVEDLVADLVEFQVPSELRITRSSTSLSVDGPLVDLAPGVTIEGGMYTAVASSVLLEPGTPVDVSGRASIRGPVITRSNAPGVLLIANDIESSTQIDGVGPGLYGDVTVRDDGREQLEILEGVEVSTGCTSTGGAPFAMWWAVLLWRRRSRSGVTSGG